jgi:hypothetical protein
MAALFTKLRVGGLELPKPGLSSPMGPYSAVSVLSPTQRIPVGPSRQVPLARAVKRAVGTPVIVVFRDGHHFPSTAIIHRVRRFGEAQ